MPGILFAIHQEKRESLCHLGSQVYTIMTMQTDFNLQSIIGQLLATGGATRSGADNAAVSEKSGMDFQAVLDNQLDASGSTATLAALQQSGKSGSRIGSGLAVEARPRISVDPAKPDSDSKVSDMDAVSGFDSDQSGSTVPDTGLPLQLETRQLLNGRPVLTSRYDDTEMMSDIAVEEIVDDLAKLPGKTNETALPGLSKSGRATQGLDVESWSRGASPDDDVDSRSGVTSPNPEMDSQSAAPYSSSASMMPPVVIPIDTNVARQTLGGPAVATDNTLSEYAQQHSYPVSHDSVTGFSRDSGASSSASGFGARTLDQSVALGGETKALDPISDANSRLAGEPEAAGPNKGRIELEALAAAKVAEAKSDERHLASMVATVGTAPRAAGITPASSSEPAASTQLLESAADRLTQFAAGSVPPDNAAVQERGVNLNQPPQPMREFTYRFSNPTAFANEVPEFLAEIIQEGSEAADQRIRLRLFPENLGRIDATISEGSDGLRIHLLAENDQIARLLRDSNSTLRDMLADGETAVQVEVGVANEGSRQSPEGSGHGDQEPGTSNEQGSANTENVTNLNSVSGQRGLDTYV